MKTHNCYTITRANIVEGIKLSTDRGPLRKWDLHVPVGDWRIPLDRQFPAKVEGGAMVRRGYPHEVKQPNGRVIYTMMEPGDGDLNYSIAKVDLQLHGVKRLAVEDRDLRLFSGVEAEAVIASKGNEALIHLRDGEVMNLFFPDGHVRQFSQEAEQLVERKLEQSEMLTLRIQNAWSRYNFFRKDKLDLATRQRRIAGVLGGVISLMNLTKILGGFGVEARERLVKEFFSKVERADLGTFNRQIEAILFQKGEDHLIPVLHGKVSAVPSIVNIDRAGAGRASSQAKKAERAAADRERRNRMRGPSSGGGSQQGKQKQKKK